MESLIGTERLIEGPEMMQDFGGAMASMLEPGTVLLLHGDLGAGKTTLAQGIARGFAIDRPVTSPTFTLVAEYAIDPPIRAIGRLYHLDLYRLNDPDELDSFGFDEYAAPIGSISIIEWPERAVGRISPHSIVIDIQPAGSNARRVTIRRFGVAAPEATAGCS